METISMKRTVTALYETRAQAERVRDALVAAHLGDDVDIRDEFGASGDKAEDGASEHHDFGTWLGHLLGNHHDKHVYIEGVRRGHFMLSAKVDELSETRAAEILDAATPLDLETAQTTWRADGWAPGDTAGNPISAVAPGKDLNDKAPTALPEAKWVGVRVYTVEESPPSA
jgi:hypothetical protein